jgi:hypothetical protein
MCPRLGNAKVAIKTYDRQRVTPTKLRAIRREAAVMMLLNRKK